MRGQHTPELDPAGVDLREEHGRTIVSAFGDWTIETIGQIDRTLRDIEARVNACDITIDFTRLGRVDTSGAYILGRLTRACPTPDGDFHFIGEHPVAQRLIAEVRARTTVCDLADTGPAGPLAMLAKIGQGMEVIMGEVLDTFGFLGKTIQVGLRTLVRPSRLRLVPTVYAMEEVGVNAMPIVATLSFFIGAVVAYMGANLLQTLGFSVFTVELVGIAVLREFGVLITAIMLAGRSDSAFTAQIGAMKMQQEVDAMRTLGLDPFEVLVLPRVIACTLMAPLLTFGAMISGIFGGMLVAWSAQGISPTLFIARFHQELPWDHFLVGMSKAPVFGLVVAIIGCRQGMQVTGDVESLGRRVTTSVVQAIFAVIVLEALFAMMYLELGI
ncbi:MAG: ABC transporter permease [Alphaproteobacteria bacterium]|nr:ABC transporter permease [Alphaproteobacteria bacterium]